MKNKVRLDELKYKLETASVGMFNRQYYETTKNEWKIIKDYGRVALKDIESVLWKDDKRKYFIGNDDVNHHLNGKFYKDVALKDLCKKSDTFYRIVPKITHWHIFTSWWEDYWYWSWEYIWYYFDWTLSLPKKPIPPKKPIKKEVEKETVEELKLEPEIETLKTQVQLATLSKSIGSKEFSIWWEIVDKKVFDMYSQYKKDWMIPSNQTWWTAPKLWTPEKYQNLSWEYFKTSILNKDERYTVR